MEKERIMDKLNELYIKYIDIDPQLAGYIVAIASFLVFLCLVIL